MNFIIVKKYYLISSEVTRWILSLLSKDLPNTQVLKNQFVCHLIFQVKTVFHEKKEVV